MAMIQARRAAELIQRGAGGTTGSANVTGDFSGKGKVAPRLAADGASFPVTKCERGRRSGPVRPVQRLLRRSATPLGGAAPLGRTAPLGGATPLGGACVGRAHDASLDA